ncbi:hypothetical protein BaRGS_00001997 [Batillaria attramentaria]|uniref:Uncharacterized protein n=1 Tax=Batillaria attramentaria TaxID=370345 RepID=A0ABD0M4J8_9CAEN
MPHALRQHKAEGRGQDKHTKRRATQGCRMQAWVAARGVGPVSPGAVVPSRRGKGCRVQKTTRLPAVRPSHRCWAFGCVCVDLTGIKRPQLYNAGP